MASAFRIREAHGADLEAIAKLYVQLKRHHRKLQPGNPRYRVSDAEWREVARRAIATEDIAMRVAELDGAIIGFAKMTLEQKPWGISCEVDTMVVDGRHRNRGVGARLLEAAEQYAKSAGAKGIRVDVLLANHEGRAFYEREGYEPFAVRYGKALPSD